MQKTLEVLDRVFSETVAAIAAHVKSRKFRTAAIAMVAVLLEYYSGLPVAVQAATVVLFGTVILGTAYEDGQAKG